MGTSTNVKPALIVETTGCDGVLHSFAIPYYNMPGVVSRLLVAIHSVGDGYCEPADINSMRQTIIAYVQGMEVDW